MQVQRVSERAQPRVTLDWIVRKAFDVGLGQGTVINPQYWLGQWVAYDDCDPETGPRCAVYSRDGLVLVLEYTGVLGRWIVRVETRG